MNENIQSIRSTSQSTTTTFESSGHDNKYSSNNSTDGNEITTSLPTDNMIHKNQSNVSNVSCESIHHSTNNENFTPPHDIALLHQETKLLLETMNLDTILNNGVKFGGKDFISPLKGGGHTHNKDSSFCSDDDDDDGMRNEVKRLQFAVDEIRNDIAIVASPSLLLDSSKVASVYEDKKDIKNKVKEDEEREKMEYNMVSFNQKFMITFTILLVYSISYVMYQRMITLSNQILDTIFFGWMNNPEL